MITPQQNGSPNPPTDHPNTPYKECLKNHAASIGGNAVDGCGEFMPSGGGSNGNDPSEALKCSVCGCHRNFHRKEVEGKSNKTIGKRKAIAMRRQKGHQLGLQIPAYGTIQMVPQISTDAPNMGADSTPSESNNDLGDGGGFGVRPAEKKKGRFRTKFSNEQKEKLMRFADKAGWKMQKLDQCVVQNFCQEIGINRKVLKVWMHNNKLNCANKNHHLN